MRRVPNIPISGSPNSYKAGGVVIGDNVFIGVGVIICKGTIIGDNVVIGHGVVLEEDCMIGDGTHIQAMAYLTKGIRVESNVFIGPMVCTTNDKRILSHGRGKFKPNAPHIGFGARIGARALIMAGVSIGENALIGAGSIITKDVAPREVWKGTQALKSSMVPAGELIDRPSGGMRKRLKATQYQR